MSEYNLKQNILSNITGSEYLNRRIYMQQPIMWWKNDVTQLNATNLNKISMGIRDVQQEFSIEAHNIQYLLAETVKNSAGWVSTENFSGTAEIFNDYQNNQALADYSHAQGHNTVAGHAYPSLEDGHIIYSGIASHAQGEGTVAVGDYQFVQGRWNALDAEEHPNNPQELIPTSMFEESLGIKGNYAHIVGAGTSKVDRKNIYTLDWSGSGWFANAITADGNASFGTNGNNRHKFKGKTLFENAVKINSNLGVYGDTKLDKTLTVNGAATLNSTLSVSGTTTLTDANVSGKTTSKELEVTENTVIDGALTSNAVTTFNNNVTFTGSDKEVVIQNKLTVDGESYLAEVTSNETTTHTLTVTGLSTLAATEIGGDLGVVGNITVTKTVDASEDVKAGEVSLVDEHNHLDYVNLTVKEKEDKTVPNAIAYTESKLIGKTSLNLDNLGNIKDPGLTNESIYGVAQYSINLVKNLLNAYILDSDNDDPEARTAIDKLIEIADWIKDDSSGAGKIISDVDNLSKNKSNWDAAYDARHSHSNIAQLEDISIEKINNWDDAYASRYTGNNVEILKDITAERVADWDAAILAEGVTMEGIAGVIAGGEQITKNTADIEVLDNSLDQLQNYIEGLDTYVKGSGDSLESRIRALEIQLNALISYGTDEPDATVTTQYYVKHD